MSVRVQVPLRVQIKKDQVRRPGFLFLGKSVELAPKDLDKNKKHGPRSGPVFFLTLFGRDSPQGNSRYWRTGLSEANSRMQRRLADRQFPMFGRDSPTGNSRFTPPSTD